MADFDNPETTQAPKASDGGEKLRADFFVAVRERGMLNASLDQFARIYEATHKGRRAKWEYYNPTKEGGTDTVMFRQSMGFQIVDFSELQFGDAPEGGIEQKGPVRRGDMVLMSCTNETANRIRLDDAVAAEADLKAPEQAFKDSVSSNKTRLTDGTVEGAEPFGRIKQTTEEIPKVAENSDL